MRFADHNAEISLAPGSFLVVSAQALGDGQLSDPEFRTFSALSKHRNSKNGLAWPSTERLARYRGIGQRALQKHLANIERLGYIEEVVDPRAPNRRSRTFLIHFSPERSTTDSKQEPPRSPQANGEVAIKRPSGSP